jgi:Domain of unknown function (DUF4168)
MPFRRFFLVLVALLGIIVETAIGTAVHVPLGTEKSHRPQSEADVGLHPRFASSSSIHENNENWWLTSARGGGGRVVDNVSKIRRFAAEGDRMPCLFSEQEEIYDRYAACLAATEGLRRMRDRDIIEQQESISAPTATKQQPGAAASSGSGGSLVPDSARLQAVAEAKHRITTKYVQQSIKVLRALGMTVSQFNGLGRDIAKDEKLKEKVRDFST